MILVYAQNYICFMLFFVRYAKIKFVNFFIYNHRNLEKLNWECKKLNTKGQIKNNNVIMIKTLHSHSMKGETNGP